MLKSTTDTDYDGWTATIFIVVALIIVFNSTKFVQLKNEWFQKRVPITYCSDVGGGSINIDREHKTVELITKDNSNAILPISKINYDKKTDNEVITVQKNNIIIKIFNHKNDYTATWRNTDKIKSFPYFHEKLKCWNE